MGLMDEATVTISSGGKTVGPFPASNIKKAADILAGKKG